MSNFNRPRCTGTSSWLGLAIVAVVALAASLRAFIQWGTRWGSTPEERAMPMPGDSYLEGGPPTRIRMTRAISVAAPPEAVWPWLAQFGRGAGWYSIDLLDNGSRSSAWHLVSWIPEPRLGDAAAIGYLRHIEPGRGLTWWQPPLPFLGASTRLVMDMRVLTEGDGSRLVFSGYWPMLPAVVLVW